MMNQLTALVWSLVLEIPVALLAARVIARVELKWTLVAAVLATLITHPCVWYLNETLTMIEPWPRLLSLEVAVVVVEGAVYLFVARMRAPMAWATSFAANAASFLIGLALYRAGVL